MHDFSQGKYMREYEINAEIELNKDRFIEFDESFEVSMPDSRVKSAKLTSSPDGCIGVQYLILGDSDEEVESEVSLHLNYLADCISFQQNMPIGAVKIKGMSYRERDGAVLNIIAINGITVRDHLSVKKKLGEEGTKRLKKFIKGYFPEKTRNYFSMYRQALSEHNIGLRYLLFYRLLEKVLGKNREHWIMAREPDVEEVARQRGKTCTIYTYLRDQIHPEQSQFPYDKVSRYVNKLGDLVRRAIDERIQ